MERLNISVIAPTRLIQLGGKKLIPDVVNTSVYVLTLYSFLLYLDFY